LSPVSITAAIAAALTAAAPLVKPAVRLIRKLREALRTSRTTKQTRRERRPHLNVYVVTITDGTSTIVKEVPATRPIDAVAVALMSAGDIASLNQTAALTITVHA